MHELAVCQGLMTQVTEVAALNDAPVVERIVLSVGPLSGVEPALLQQAFEIARLGTVAETARLEIRGSGVTVECRECGAGGEVGANRLLCPACGHWHVTVTAGDELLLLSVELSGLATPSRQAV